jgi:hypothetical protein
VQSFAEFWPFYLNEHKKPFTRALHLTGTSLSFVLILSALALRRPVLIVPAVLCGYAFAWVGHFFVEHNRPATFKHPLWSFAADLRMLAFALSGRLPGELQKAGVKPG